MSFLQQMSNPLAEGQRRGQTSANSCSPSAKFDQSQACALAYQTQLLSSDSEVDDCHLESGGGKPSLTVLVKVAGALAVPLTNCLHRRERRCARRRRSIFAQPGEALRCVRWYRNRSRKKCSVMEFAPNAGMAGTPHLPGTREFLCLRAA
jgi:hypothetical protein